MHLELVINPAGPLDKPSVTDFLVDMRAHDEATHVSLKNGKPAVTENILNALEFLGARPQGMLMDEVQSAAKLVPVEQHAAINVLDPFPLFFLISLQPLRVVAVCVLLK